MWHVLGIGQKVAEWFDKAAVEDPSLLHREHLQRMQIDAMLGRLVSLGLSEAHEIEMRIEPLAGQTDGRQYTVLLDGKDVTWDIRSPAVDSHVSLISSYPGVRSEMVRRQRLDLVFDDRQARKLLNYKPRVFAPVLQDFHLPDFK